MGKLWKFFDEKLLKIGVSFAFLFIVLYPKLPSVHINNTWVYIRLEDFVIAFLSLVWIIQFLRKKVSIPWPLSLPIFLYWVAGLCSLIFSLIFVGPHIANFFPKIAALEYFRRIEYMALFFITFSTITSSKDIRDYFVIVCITLTGVVLYGFGQRWYLNLWALAPSFFEKYSFCFPSFQTGNEEFAKGIPLCLPFDARITSTFGGHYDLAAFLVVVIPILIAGIFVVKKIWTKIYVTLLSLASILLLILTASRVSFVAYLVGSIATLIFFKKKKFIIPLLVVSLFFLMLFSGSTAKRFLETIRFTNVVTNSSGQVVGVATNTLPKDLQSKISKNPVDVAAPPPTQNLPTGSSFITLPQVQAPTKTTVAVVQSSIKNNNAKKYVYGGVEISKVNGNFLVQKALVYDISFTTRFQGEWPNAIRAFSMYPLFGAGYATLTLATDNDYLRFLGESGVTGFFTFALVFIFMSILLKNAVQNLSDFQKAFVFGISGGLLGLFLNASLIDVFEASKVAEPLWLLLGAGAGVLLMQQRERIDYKKGLVTIFTSPVCMFLYLLVILGIAFAGSISNFFVADDFTWLHWAASSTLRDILEYFTKANGFFYRPIDKLVMFFLNTVFAFQPEGYRICMLFVHLLVSFAVYLLAKKIFKKNSLAFFASALFLLLPGHGENVYWISTISNNLSALFIMYALLTWYKFREQKSMLAYWCTIFWTILALLSYEASVVLPLLFAVMDIFILKPMLKKKDSYMSYLPVVFLVFLYALVRPLTGAVKAGGDYAINMVHLIPNVFGNLFGYLGLFIFGEYSLPFYTHLRSSMRSYGMVGLLIGIILFALVLGMLIIYRKVVVSSKNGIVFGLVFAIIALLPFLGLGNLSERYFYLASVGLVISLTGIGNSLLTVLLRKKIKIILGIAVIIAACILVISGITVAKESLQWKQAGDITGKTLFTFRTQYEDLNNTNTVYIINLPIRHDNAWVFPIGLSDGLWFIYRDEMPIVRFAKTIQQAQDSKQSDANPSKVLIFSFNKNGEISEVQ